MKSAYVFLPIIALLVGAIGTAMGSTLPDAQWMTALGWASAIAIIVFWITIDFANFRRFFRGKTAKYGLSSGAVTVAGIAVLIGLASLSTRPRFNKTFDVTRDKLNTLSDQSLKVIQSIKESGESVTVLGFFQDDETKTQFRELAGLFEEKGAKFSAEYLDPRFDVAKAKSEKLTAGNTVILKFKEQEERITTFNEEKFTNALANLLKARGKKVVYFTTGHGEGELVGNDPNSYGELVNVLEGAKYEAKPLQILTTPDIPTDASAVVIAGPRYDLKPEEVNAVENYLKRGGSLLVLTNSLVQIPNIQRITADFGIQINNDFVGLGPDDQRAVLLQTRDVAIVTTFDQFHALSKDFAKDNSVAMLFTTTRSVSDLPENKYQMKVTLAAKTAEDLLRIKDVKSEEDLNKAEPSRMETGGYGVVAAASGKPEATKTAQATNENATAKADVVPEKAQGDKEEIRLVVAGSTQFATNGGLQRPENRDMILNMINFLAEDESSISIRPKDPTKSTIDATSGLAMLLLVVLSLIYPFAYLAGGVIYWLRRRSA